MSNKVILLALTAWVGLSACHKESSIQLSQVDETPYTLPGQDQGLVWVTPEGATSHNTIELRSEALYPLQIHSRQAVSTSAEYQLVYATEQATTYNQEHGTDYPVLPQEAVSFDKQVSIPQGKDVSQVINIKIQTAESLTSQQVYLLPLLLQDKQGRAVSEVTLLVKEMSKIPSAAKSTGIEIISCMEVNDTNPLVNLRYTLKNSGKPLIDQVILFSANINYDPVAKRVYVFKNPQVTAILENRDHYIKPLQDRGIKVILGILGNHDRAAITNLNDESARQFAQELKNVCTAYGLDGVFFDDEYSKIEYPAPAGFVYPSRAATSRLCYETKQAMPDRLIEVYVYGGTNQLISVDGHQPGEFLDYALHDYLASFDLSRNYPGLPKSRWGLSSQEFNRGYWASDQALHNIRQMGAAHMIFALDPNRSNGSRQLQALKKIAQILFDDELVDDGTNYPADQRN